MIAREETYWVGGDVGLTMPRPPSQQGKANSCRSSRLPSSPVRAGSSLVTMACFNWSRPLDAYDKTRHKNVQRHDRARTKVVYAAWGWVRECLNLLAPFIGLLLDVPVDVVGRANSGTQVEVAVRCYWDASISKEAHGVIVGMWLDNKHRLPGIEVISVGRTFSLLLAQSSKIRVIHTYLLRTYMYIQSHHFTDLWNTQTTPRNTNIWSLILLMKIDLYSSWHVLLSSRKSGQLQCGSQARYEVHFDQITHFRSAMH